LPVGIGLRQVLDIKASRSDSYHMFNAPAAPAPKETNKIPIMASLVETRFGDVNKPTAQVKITNDITLGFINLNNSEKLNKSSWLKLLFLVFELFINFLSYTISCVIFVLPLHLQILAIHQMYENLVEMVQSILR